jgi:hypothetical protein
MAGMSVIPICGAASVAVLDPGCTSLGLSVACQGFGLNGSCVESNLPAGVCKDGVLQLYATPLACSGQVYLVMPPSACSCSDAAAYVACLNTAGTPYEGCSCGSPPTGFTAACPTGANGLSTCLIDAGHSAHADCGEVLPTKVRDADVPPDAREANVVAVADSAFGDAALD